MSLRGNSDGTYDVLDSSGKVVATSLYLSTAQEVDNRQHRPPSETETMVASATSGCVGWLFSWSSQPLIKKHPYLLTKLALIMWPAAIAFYIYNAQSARPANQYLVLTAVFLLFAFPSPLLKKILRVILWIALVIFVLWVIVGIIHLAH